MPAGFFLPVQPLGPKSLELQKLVWPKSRTQHLILLNLSLLDLGPGSSGSRSLCRALLPYSRPTLPANLVSSWFHKVLDCHCGLHASMRPPVSQCPFGSMGALNVTRSLRSMGPAWSQWPHHQTRSCSVTMLCMAPQGPAVSQWHLWFTMPSREAMGHRAPGLLWAPPLHLQLQRRCETWEQRQIIPSGLFSVLAYIGDLHP